MPEQRTERQHYIPQFLLSKFADNKGNLCCYFRDKDKYCSMAPRNICFEKNLYEVEWKGGPPGARKYILDNGIENDLSVVEGQYADLIEHILCRCDLSSSKNSLICMNAEETRLLADFCANIFLRNPSIMEVGNLDVIPEKAHDNTLIKSIAEIFRTMELGDWQPLYRRSLLKAWLDSGLVKSPAYQFREELLSHNYCFYTNTDSRFIFANVPCLFSSNDSGSILSFYLPLSPRFAVRFSSYVDRKNRNRVVQLDNEQVMTINSAYFQYDSTQVTSFYGLRREDIDLAMNCPLKS